MGGCCCCSSRKPHLNGTSVYYYYPSVLEEQESFTSPDSVTTILDRGLIADVDMDMSTPNTYRSPPAPIPYDMSACVKFKGSYHGTQKGNFVSSPKKLSELLKLDDAKTMEEEDVCPTCLEEYDDQNPKIITKCNHHYHLSCILEWMERSNTCPICNQEMDFEAT